LLVSLRDYSRTDMSLVELLTSLGMLEDCRNSGQKSLRSYAARAKSLQPPASFGLTSGAMASYGL
jgi:hypothetical protein